MRLMSVSTASVVRACGAAASLACCAGAAHATAFSWATGVSANWNTSARWTPMGVPSSSADTASITVAPDSSPYTVTVSNGFTLGGLTLDQPQATVLIGGGGQLAMASGAAVNLTAGKLSINGGSLTQAGAGTFTMAPGSTLETFSNVTMPSGMAYTLGGAIVMDGTLQGFPAAGWTNGGAITLTGPALSWLFSTGPMTNDGTITADTAGGGRRIQTPITNSATGAIVMNADTEWRSGPHSNSGFVKVALFKTLTVGSFATVNQHAGNFLVAGSYTHLNGAFNMNGGALTVQQSFFKDGGNFAYNGGTIDGAPTLRNAVLTLNPGATNPATFALRGGGNTLVGAVGPDVTLCTEATALEPAGVSAFGDLTNDGVILLHPSVEHPATISSLNLDGLNGALYNQGRLGAERAPTAGLDSPLAAAAFLTLLNADTGIFEAGSSVRFSLDAIQAIHQSRGQVRTAAPTRIEPEGAIVIEAGSASTFRQEAGTIINDGAFIVEQGCTFEHAGGACTGNPIRIEGGALTIGPGAEAGEYALLGGNNIITADEIAANQRIILAPDTEKPGTSDGGATWSPDTVGETPAMEGEFEIVSGGGLRSALTVHQALLIAQFGKMFVTALEDYIRAVIIVNSLPLQMRGRIIWAEETRGGDGAASFTGMPLELQGDYSQTPTGTLAPRMFGDGLSDRLEVSGAAALDGSLELGLGAGYAPAWGHSASVMTYASRTGDFASFAAPTLPAHLRWWRSAGATAYTIGVRHIADTNHDGVVDFLDLNNVLSYFGLPAPPGSAATIGDANTDGVVDFLDLNHVLGAFGTSAP